MSDPIEPGTIVMVDIPQYNMQKGEELEVIAVNRAMDGCTVLNVKKSNGRYVVIPAQNVVFKRKTPEQKGFFKETAQTDPERPGQNVPTDPDGSNRS